MEVKLGLQMVGKQDICYSEDCFWSLDGKCWDCGGKCQNRVLIPECGSEL